MRRMMPGSVSQLGAVSVGIDSHALPPPIAMSETRGDPARIGRPTTSSESGSTLSRNQRSLTALSSTHTNRLVMSTVTAGWDSSISSTPRPPKGIGWKGRGSEDVQPVIRVATARAPPRTDRAPRHILRTWYGDRTARSRSRDRYPTSTPRGTPPTVSCSSPTSPRRLTSRRAGLPRGPWSSCGPSTAPR